MIKSLSINKEALKLFFICSAVIGVSISYADFYMFHFALFLLAFFWFYEFREEGYKLNIKIFSETNILVPFILLFWYVISLLWAPDILLGLKYIFYIFCGLILVVNIVYYSSSKEATNKLFKFLSYLIVLNIIIGLFESFTFFRMPISSYSPLSIFFGKEPINYSPFDNIINYSMFNPPTGFHWNTNDMAICVLIALPFFLCSSKFYVKIFGVSAITTLIIMAASRAVFLGLVLTFILYLIFIKKRIGTLLTFWLVSFAFIWSMSLLRTSNNPRINEIANSAEAIKLYLGGEIDIGGSIEWRRQLVKNGLNAFKKTYGLGLGSGGTVANQEQIGPVAGRFTSMHNFWVELLVEGGIFIAFLFLLWFLNIVLTLLKISKKNNNPDIKYYSQSLFLSVCAFVPSAIAASSTIYFFPMWIMFGFAIAIIRLDIQKN
tara:strand:+ start:453 stop:1751 length:1299 start_codon:yes stop_codon:yes gene_type:complete